MKKKQLAIIGSGPTALFLLKHISDQISILKNEIHSITIFEKEKIMGMGMPYNPETTDQYNLANISSEEIPELPQTFADWLRLQKKEVLEKWNITTFPILDSEVYSRLALGQYFHEQYQLLIEKLKTEGIVINEFINHTVTDITIETEKNIVKVISKNSKSYEFDKIVIATGHTWSSTDKPKTGYFASPWPIKKLIPKTDEYFNFPIGILGASLSAFDVVTSLAHRHGDFRATNDGLVFCPNEKAKDFKIILHSAEGWLPHLQYAQAEPIREIYRHTDRKEILSLVDSDGFLNLNTFFNKICRPALIEAFSKDKMSDTIKLIEDPDFSFKDFVSLMSQKHEYIDSFIGMEKERVLALDSLKNNKPMHWMETIDDLIYCLNYHTELLCAEDHLFFGKEILPFQMNVIAALPLNSAKILIALHQANCIDLVEGKVTITDSTSENKETEIKIESENGIVATASYKMFINCTGQEKVEVENYPFPSMAKMGTIRRARARFKEIENAELDKNVFYKNNEAFLFIGGIDIDNTFKVIRKDGNAEPKIHNIAFTHITGSRPYSSGLQACNASSSIVVESWILLNQENPHTKTSIESITKLYEENEDL
ncbi:FAD/NAD(P)-binding protein [Flavobacterium sp. FBOR7N2.3]|uniref:FAD/NAD(P)-binding protein n=1 Tax=Flavobacterium magnesitis TaxID=3138077 RepID=A0ABV4TNF7_9FLAO